MQIISNDKTVRISKVQDLTDFHSQFLTSQAEKEEQLVTLVLAIKKDFDLMGDGIVKLSTENESLL